MLLRGPSGAGKSDLSLRAAAKGWRLVADDRVLAWTSGGRLFGRAPATIAGLIEARGLGVLQMRHLALAEIVLVVDLAVGSEGLERLPDPAWEIVEGVRLPRLTIAGREPSAPAKLELALRAVTLGAEPEPAYQAARADEVEAPDGRAGASHEE